MGKSTVGKIAIGAAIVGLAFATGGATLVPGIAATSATVGGATFATAAVAGSLATTAFGSTLLLAGTSLALSGVAQGIGLGPKMPVAQLSRLKLNFDTNAPRKMVFGHTAMGTDVVYWEPYGTNQENVSYVIACAAHKVTSIEQVWIDDKLAWTSSGGVQAGFTGFLSVSAVLEGSSSNTVAINGGTTWGSTCRLTGCAYIVATIKRTGTKAAESPFANGLSGRVTIIGKGMPVYDARYDSTNGGSGSMRPHNQATWAYAVSGNDIGENPANQWATSMLGWKIGGEVSVGAGLPAARLDLADQITAANIADETVGGGKRYRTHGMFADDQAASEIQRQLCVHMNAQPRDTSGKLGIRVAHNDLSGSLVTFTEDDILSGVQWTPAAPLDQFKNVVSGRYTDPSSASLYQLAPYTSRSGASPDGINRPLPLDLSMFQDPRMAERVAEQVRVGQLYQGRATLTLGPRSLACEEGQPVRLTFGPRGWTNKLFRVERQVKRVILTDEDAVGFSSVVLIEENSAIYADPTTTAPGAALATPSFDPLHNVMALAAAQASLTAVTTGITSSTGELLGDIDLMNAYAPDSNLFGDPNFLDITGPHWLSMTAGVALGGSTDARYLVFSSPSVRLINGIAKPCAPGQRIDAQFDVYPEFGTTNTCSIIAMFMDGDGTPISTETAVAGSASSLPAGTWTTLRGSTPSAPAGTQMVRVGLQADTVNSGTHWLARRPRAYIAELATANISVNSRVTKSRFMSTALLFSAANTVSAIATATDQGGSTGVTVTIPAHVRRIATDTGYESISYSGGTLTNRPYETSGLVYTLDPSLTGGSVTYLWTTDPNDLIGPGVYHVTTITTPSDGGAPTSGSGGAGESRPPLRPGGTSGPVVP